MKQQKKRSRHECKSLWHWGTFKKYVRSRFRSFEHPHPHPPMSLLYPCSFSSNFVANFAENAQRQQRTVQRKERKMFCKVKTAGESDRTPFIDRTEYYNLSWWLFKISYRYYNQFQKLENNYKTSFWKSQHFFLKSKRTHMLGRPLLLFVFVCLLNKRTFWMTPCVSYQNIFVQICQV